MGNPYTVGMGMDRLTLVCNLPMNSVKKEQAQIIIHFLRGGKMLTSTSETQQIHYGNLNHLSIFAHYILTFPFCQVCIEYNLEMSLRSRQLLASVYTEKNK